MHSTIGPKSLDRLPVFIVALVAFLAGVDSTNDVRHLHNEVGTDRISHQLRESQRVRGWPPSSWFGKADPKRPELMGAINQFRAKICFDMKTGHGKKFDSYEDCKKFMFEACKPGGDLNMDGDKGEHSSGHGYCKAYFSKDDMEKELKEAEKNDEKLQAKLKEAEKNDEKLQAKKAAAVKAAEGDEVVEGAKEGSEAGEKKDKTGKGAGAPAPAPAGASGPAAAPSSGGKLPANEAWYYKNGGIDAGRFHMNEKMKLPTHGYHGPLVEHEDMVTGTSDWRAEFGDSDATSVAAACKHHPESRWCHKKTGRRLGHFGYSGSLASAHFPVILLIGVISSIM